MLGLWAKDHEPWLRQEVENGFLNRPPKKIWEARWKNITGVKATGRGGGGGGAAAMESANAAACKTPILSTMKSCNGFGSRINTFMGEVLLAMYTGLPIAVCGNQFARDVFYANFDAADTFPECLDPICREDRLLPESTFISMALDPDFQKMKMGVPAVDAIFFGIRTAKKESKAYFRDLRRFVYQKVYRLAPSTQELVDRRAEQVGLSLLADHPTQRRPYVGVHIRRSDKGIEAKPVSETKYAEVVAHFLDKLGANTVYLASDEPEKEREALLEGLMQAGVGPLPSVLSQTAADVGLQAKSDDSQSEMKRNAYRDRKALVGLFTDVQLLQKAGAFVGTASSNIGQLVYFLRPGSAPSASVDEPFQRYWR